MKTIYNKHKKKLLNQIYIKYYMIKAGNDNKKIINQINRLINKIEKL